jgi:hypothetical protein
LTSIFSTLLNELCIEVQNIWVRPPDQKDEADAAKAELTIPDGDHLTLLNVYDQYQQSWCFHLFPNVQLIAPQIWTTKNGRRRISFPKNRLWRQRKSVNT